MPESTPPPRDQILVTPAPVSVAWPLTADNLDTNGGNALVALTGNPISTGVGFVANGSDTKLAGDLPSWARSAGGQLALHVIATPPLMAVDWREVVVNVSTGVAGQDQPKLELAVFNSNSAGVVVLRVSAGGTSPIVHHLNRTGWRFHFRVPELRPAGTVWPFQSLCFLDANTLVFAVKNPSVIYRVDLSTGEYTGRASSTVYETINSMHADPDGNVWCQCRINGLDEIVQLDLAASFSTGAITEASRWNTGDVPVSAITFATVGGVEYVLLSAFAVSGTPRAFAFLRSQMSGPVNQVDRVKRWRCGVSAQDLAFNPTNGRVYFQRFQHAAGVEGFDLAAILAGADDATPSPAQTLSGPSNQGEGIDFQPGTGRAFVGTEYGAAGGSGWGGVWSSALAGPEENAYLIDYFGGAFEVRVNQRLMLTAAQNLAPAPLKIGVGAHPAASAGQTGFLTSGTVRALAIKSAPFTQTELDALA